MARRRLVKDKASQTSPLPSYLLERPDHSYSVPAPSLTREQCLPFSRLTWENFERLCKVLVETDSEINACKMYGRPGHRQYGFDLIAFTKDLKDTKPQIYQCKRVEKFTAAQIKGAVKKFTDNLPTLRRKWRSIPSRFVLCCRCALPSPECQDEIVRQRTRLAKLNISFETWDEDELSTRLKDHERIVDEFFEREWVKAFNGQDAALALAQRFALAPSQITASGDVITSLVISKDLEIQTLTAVVDGELLERCKMIREKFRQGHEQEALLELQSYLDRFDTDLYSVSRFIRAKFWHTAGILRWKLQVTRPQAKVCLEKARHIDPALDVRDLSARILIGESRFEEALQVLDLVDTQQVPTLKLALLLDLRRLDAFDDLWLAFEQDDLACELLAYRQRIDRKLIEAQQSIQACLKKSPEIPAHLLAAAHIYFWSAVPEHLDKTPRSILPAWIHPLFYAPTASQSQLLDKAADHYVQACALVGKAGPSEKHQVRDIEEFLLLCRAYHPLQIGQAQELALRLLAEDPTVFTALFYCLEWNVSFDIDRSIQGLESKYGHQEASLNDLYVLAQLYERKGDLNRATLLLEAETQRFSSLQEQGLWLELLSSLYIREGKVSKARTLVAGTVNDPAFILRLQALEHDISENHEEVERAALLAWETSKGIIDLVNLCGFYRKTDQWIKLEPLARQLALLSPDPRSLWYMVESLYRTNQYEQCREVIEKYRSVWLEPSVLANIRRIEVECLIKLNRLDHAVIQLEGIRRERPNPEIVQRLAQAYFRLGRREQAVTVLREAVAQPGADTQLLIGTSQLLVRESPEEAFRLAQRAIEEDAQDPSIRMFYIETGFLTGHDLEASESLRTFRERFPTSTALKSVAFSEAMQQVAAQQQVRRDRWNLYRRAEAPVHVWMDVEHHPLGFDWYVRFESNLKAGTWNSKRPIYARHGSRGPDAVVLPPETKGIIIDYTSLLLCHRVGLLPIVEQAFERIIIAPSTLALLQMESLNAAQFQLSRLTLSQVLKVSLDTGSIRVLNEIPSDEVLRELQLQDLGRTDSLLFYLARQGKGLVLVQQLAKESMGPFELCEELSDIRVFPLEVLTAMAEVGALSKQELASLAPLCGGQPCRAERVLALTKKPSLMLDIGTAEFFAHHGLLERVTRVFRMGVPKSEADHITFTLEEYRLRQEASQWLDGLNRYLSERLNSRYFFPSVPIPDSPTRKKEPCTQILEEVLHAAISESYVLWSDDRMVTRHTHTEGKAIVTIDAVIAFLKVNGLLSSEQYYERLLSLMTLNVMFLPLNSDLVMHYLRLTGVSVEGFMRESYELKTIRRYVTYAFSQETALQPSPVEQGKPSEAAAYFHSHREGCREILIEIWTDKTFTRQYKDVSSKWIVERLWKGIEDIAHLESKALNPEAMAVVSQTLLIGIGLVMMFRDIEQRGENAASFLAWLYEEYLESFWESNPQVAPLVLEKVRQMIIGLVDKEVGEEQKISLTLLAHVLATTSKAFSALILESERMHSIFRSWLQTTVQVNDKLKVPVNEWHQWGFDAIAAGTDIPREVLFGDKKLVVQWHETSIFTAGLGVQVTEPDESRTIIIQSDPFLKLQHPTQEIREQALQSVVPYLEMSHHAIDSLMRRLSSGVDREALATEVKHKASESWNYFWERLKHFVISQVPIQVDMAFPSQPAVFSGWFELPSSAYQDPQKFNDEYEQVIEQSIRSKGVEVTMGKVLGLPRGGCFAEDAALGKLLFENSPAKHQIESSILACARTSTNPIVLVNCLDGLLRCISQPPSVEAEIKNILRKLLTSSNDPQSHRITSSCKLYEKALHFAWCRMESLESYKSFPVLQRIFWAFAYATGLTGIADEMSDQNKFEIDREALANWMGDKISRPGTAIFEDSFDEHLEVSHPMNMMPFRMRVSATLRILVEHKDNVSNLVEDLLQLAIDTAKSIIRGTEGGGWDIYKPFVNVRNWFRAPWGHNAIESLKILLDGPLSDRFSSVSQTDLEIITSIRTFQGGSMLLTCLDRVIASGSWNSGDLLLVFLALSEPTDLGRVAKIRKAMQFIDFSRFQEEKDFQIACGVLARAGASTKDHDLCREALEKLKYVWKSEANEIAHYVSIIDAAVKIYVTLGDAASFYPWWENTIDVSPGEIHTEVQSLLAGLAWTTPITCQGSIPVIRAKVGVL